jgi:hypothetical protein
MRATIWILRNCVLLLTDQSGMHVSFPCGSPVARMTVLCGRPSDGSDHKMHGVNQLCTRAKYSSLAFVLIRDRIVILGCQMVGVS